MNEVLETLKKARELLAQPNAWTKGCLARNAKGDVEAPRDAEATCWCAAGALYKVTEYSASADLLVMKVWDALEEVTIERSHLHVGLFNDAQDSVEPVLEIFDVTIARLEVGQ